MRFGKFDKKIEIHEFSNDGRLAKTHDAYADIRHEGARCVFSQLGVGSEETLVLTLYSKSYITRGVIFRIGSDYYAPSVIKELDNNIYCEARCGLCNIVTAVKDVYTVSRGEYGKAERTLTDTVTFDAVFTEKYISSDATLPGRHVYASDNRAVEVVISVYILSCPKSILLSANDIVNAGGEDYIVKVMHRCEYRNEYEVIRKADA